MVKSRAHCFVIVVVLFIIILQYGGVWRFILLFLNLLFFCSFVNKRVFACDCSMDCIKSYKGNYKATHPIEVSSCSNLLNLSPETQSQLLFFRFCFFFFMLLVRVVFNTWKYGSIFSTIALYGMVCR